MPRTQVAVLGAGLTGACAALHLARQGAEVVLVDQDTDPMNRASLRNEGKVHIGFVYANEPSLATARLMLEGALSFRRIVDELAGSPGAGLILSSPFFYLVAPDSVLAPDELDCRYAGIEAMYLRHLASHPDSDYLGLRPGRLYRPVPLAALPPCISSARLAGAFCTQEYAVDTDALARAIRSAVQRSPRIRFLASHQVAAVERTAGGFIAHGTHCSEGWELRADQVVNALWEDRLRVDATIGLNVPGGWLHRLKYRVIARLPDELRDGPSATMVLGPYGDVVIRPDGTGFFSWYPVGLQGWSHDLAPPEAWDPACKGKPDPEEARILGAGILAAIDEWYPGAARSKPISIDAGVIVAYGKSDVDDPASGLHGRTRVGVTSDRGYHSVDPGKFTTAPLFGVKAAEAALAGVERRVTESA